MKTLFFASALLISSVSFAKATCPAGTDAVLVCASNPQVGDNFAAVHAVDSIAVCQNASETLMVAEHDGQVATAPATAVYKANRTSFTVVDADVATDLVVSYITGIVPAPVTKATLSLIFKDQNNLTVSSTLACGK